jgi:hypothetical protein
LKENNLKKLPLLLIKSKKEVKIQHLDEKYFKKYLPLYLYRKEK